MVCWLVILGQTEGRAVCRFICRPLSNFEGCREEAQSEDVHNKFACQLFYRIIIMVASLKPADLNRGRKGFYHSRPAISSSSTIRYCLSHTWVSHSCHYVIKIAIFMFNICTVDCLIGYNKTTLCTDYYHSFIYYLDFYMFRHSYAIFRERPVTI
jgi:hypothetical protein